MSKKTPNPGPPDGAVKPPPPPAPPAKKIKSVWSNSPTPYMVELMEEIDRDDIREIVVTKGCCVGMTTSFTKP